jgi:3-oxoacyl-[acyl-carrier-protein] synthase II
MIAGGSEACIDPISINGFCRLRAMSTNFNDTPALASRPFDSNRDGFVMSEGAAVLILEEREHALRRGIPILCEIAGYGLTGDGFHVTSPDTNGRGAEQAMKTAISRAGLTVVDVDYINAHATSTPLGDKIEASVIDRLVREPIYLRRDTPLFVSSTKGATGHLLGASGALEAAFVCCSVRDGVVPPTWNLDDDTTCMGNIDSFHLPRTLIKTSINAAISNSFGFGGTNASLLIRRHEA